MNDLTITDFVGEAWWFIAAVLIVGFVIQAVQRRRLRKRPDSYHSRLEAFRHVAQSPKSEDEE